MLPPTARERDCVDPNRHDSDTLPFKCLARHLTNAQVLYVDIDFPELVAVKASVIAQTPELHGLLTNPQHYPEPDDNVHYRSDQYLALGCDLRHLETLQRLFDKHRLVDCAILLTAEVSLTYMPRESVDALIEWAALLPDGRPSFFSPSCYLDCFLTFYASTLLHPRADAPDRPPPPVRPDNAQAL